LIYNIFDEIFISKIRLELKKNVRK